MAVIRSLIRFGYVPLLLLGVNGAGIWSIATGHPAYVTVALFVAAAALSFVAERVLPYANEWNTPQGDLRRDVFHAVVNEGSNVAAIAALPLVASLVTIFQLWPRSWPFVLQVLSAVVVFDLGVTLAHFASHKVGWLWRFHAVHHSVRRFYGFNGLMKHPIHQAIEMTAGVAPLLLIGLPSDVAHALALVTGVQLLLQHSNVDYRVGPLRHLLALNEGHRFHHLRWPHLGDVNFGLFTLLWDHVLGTYRFDPGRRFTSDDLGMAAAPDYPDDYDAQLIAPFTAGRNILDNATRYYYEE